MHIVCHFPHLSLQEVNTHRGHQVSLNQFRNVGLIIRRIQSHEETDAWCLFLITYRMSRLASPADIRSDAWSNAILSSCMLFLLNHLYSY